MSDEVEVIHLGDTIARFVGVVKDSGTKAVVPTTGLTAKALFRLNRGSEIERAMQPLSPESSGAFAYRFTPTDYSQWLNRKGLLRARVRVTDTSGDLGLTSMVVIPVEE